MNSDIIVKLILATAAVVISLTALIGGFKEGKDAFKKLNEHLDEKDKEAKGKEYQSHAAHQ